MSELDKAIAEAKKAEHTVGQALSGFTVNDILKEKIVAGYMSIAMYHHRSIILLIEQQLHSSASALARPLLEACYRGTWVSLIADDEISEKINSSTYTFKPTWEVAKEIDSVIGDEVFYTVFNLNKDVLNGMTHGGIELIARQFDKDGSAITSSFSDEELIELLQSSNSHLGMTLLGFSYNLKNDKLMALAKKLIIE